MNCVCTRDFFVEFICGPISGLIILSSGIPTPAGFKVCRKWWDGRGSTPTGSQEYGTHDATKLRPLRGRNFSYQSVRWFSKRPISTLCKKGWLSFLSVISILIVNPNPSGVSGLQKMVGWERFDPVGVAEIPERMMLQTYDLSEVGIFRINR